MDCYEIKTKSFIIENLKGTPLHYAAEIGRFTQNKEKWITMKLH